MAQLRPLEPTADQEQPAPFSIMQKLVVADVQPDDNGPARGGDLGRSLLSEGLAKRFGLQPNLVQPNDFSYWKVTGPAFSPRKSTSTHDYVSNGCIFQNGGTDFRFQTPLLLPEGSSLKYVRLYYVDTAATDMTVWLTKYQPGSGNQDIVSVQSSGATGFGTTLSKLIGGPDPGDPPAEFVDNATNAYVLTWGTSVANNTNQLCGVRVAYYPPAPGEYNSVSPCRLINTRVVGPQTDGLPLNSPGPYLYRVQGNCGVPNGATSAAINIKVISPTHTGHLRLYAAGTPVPGVSQINFVENVVAISNAAIVPLSAVVNPDDKDLAVLIVMDLPGSMHFVVDVAGYFY
ncbi:MAG TPA: hypothetical protein VII12_13490 [Thermoanaerobaculia bacterium]